MPRVAPLKNDFSGGALGDFVHGRRDTERYVAGVALCENWIPTLQGPITRRVGSFYINELKDSSRRARLFRFEVSKFQKYILIFEHQVMRAVKNDDMVTFTATNITAVTKANPAVVTSNAHGLTNGDRVLIRNVGGMLELNNREFRVAGATANTFQLQDAQSGTNVNSTAFGTYTSGGTVAKIFQLTHTYTEDELPDIQYIQSNDVLFLMHPDHQQRKLTRVSDTSWTLADLDLEDGPYLDENTTAVTFTPSATIGAITITASSATFASTDATAPGRAIRIQHGSTIGWARVTGFTSTTQVSATVQRAFGATTASTKWRLGLWSHTTGFPTNASFFQTRLGFSGSDAQPNRKDLSVPNDFENFSPTDGSGTITDANAIALVTDSNEINGIEWMAPTDRGLVDGTSGGEFLTGPNSQTTAITPTDAVVRQLTFYGSAPIQPVRAGRSILYFQRSARRLLEMAFFIESDGFQSADLSTLNEDATLSGIREIAYTKEPQPILWCVREDGALVAVTFARDADALRVAWHEHVLGGTSTAGGDPTVVESVAVVPAPGADYDEVFLICRRRINGRTVRTVEALDRAFDKTVWQHNAYYVDCGLSLDTSVAISNITNASPAVVTTSSAHGLANGDSVFITETTGMRSGTTSALNGRHFVAANVTGTTLELKHPVSGLNVDGSALTPYGMGGKIAKRVTSVSGLSHLEGQTVAVVGDGGVQAQRTVTNGAITLQFPAAFVHVGLPYTSDLQLLPFEAGAVDGTAEGKIQRFEKITFRLHRTAALKFGQDFDTARPILFRTAPDDAGIAPPLFTGPKTETAGPGYSAEAKLCLRVDQPLPATLLSVALRLAVQDKG